MAYSDQYFNGHNRKCLEGVRSGSGWFITEQIRATASDALIALSNADATINFLQKRLASYDAFKKELQEALRPTAKAFEDAYAPAEVDPSILDLIKWLQSEVSEQAAVADTFVENQRIAADKTQAANLRADELNRENARLRTRCARYEAAIKAFNQATKAAAGDSTSTTEGS